MKNRLITFLLEVLILAIVSCNFTTNIYPVKHKPLISKWNNKSLETVLRLQFTLNSSAVKVLQSNYSFGIIFPLDVFPLLTDYSCDLKVGKLLINTTINKNSSEPNIFYCSISYGQFIQIKKETVITLKITLQKSPLKSFIQTVGLMLGTNPSQDKIILASNPVFGDMLFYDDYLENSNFNLLEIDNLDIENTTRTYDCELNSSRNNYIDAFSYCNKLFPYSNFNLKIKLTSKSFFWTKSDEILMIEINKKQSVIWNEVFFSNQSYKYNSNDLDTNATDDKLFTILGFKTKVYNDNLNFQEEANFQINSNTKRFLLFDFDENLTPGRKFQLNLSGLQTTIPDSLGVIESVNVYVLKKNSNTVVSFSSFNTVSFPVYEYSFQLPENVNWSGIAHPEFRDIFENSSWPLKFNLQVPPMLEGGELSIEHISTDEKIFNFISSTCEFNYSTNLGNEILNGKIIGDYLSTTPGNRPLCSPTKELDLSTTEGNNSGIKINLKSTKGYKDLVFSVWGVAIKCGNMDYLNETPNNNLDFNALNKNEEDLSKILSFKLVFKNKNNIVLSQKVVEMTGKCFTNIVHSKSDSNLFKTNNLINTSVISSTKDILLLKEIYDWEFLQKRTETEDFGSASRIKSIIKQESVGTDPNSFDNLISFKTTENLPYPTFNNLTPYQGYFKLEMTSDYFSYNPEFNTKIKTDGFLKASSQTNCSLYYQTQGSPIQKLVRNNSNTNSTVGPTWLQNTFTNTSQTKLPFRIDNAIDYKYLDSQYYSQIKFISTDINTGAGNGLTFASNTNSNFLGIETDCFILSDKSKIEIRSINSYIDFGFSFYRKFNNKYTLTRHYRFIKLYPNIQVFNTDNLVNSSFNLKTTYYHTYVDNKNDGICILLIKDLDMTKMQSNLILNFLNTRFLDNFVEEQEYPVSIVIYQSGITKDTSTVSAFARDTEYPFSSKAFKNLKGGQLGYSNDNFSASRRFLGITLPIPGFFNKDSLIKKLIFTKDKQSKNYYSFFSSKLEIRNLPTDSDSLKIDITLPISCPIAFNAEDSNDTNNQSHIYQSLSIFTYGEKFKNIYLHTTSTGGLIHQLTDSIGTKGIINNNTISFTYAPYLNSSITDSALNNKRVFFKSNVDCKAVLLLTNGFVINNNSIENKLKLNSSSESFDETNYIFRKPFILKGKEYNQMSLFFTTKSFTTSSFFDGIIRPNKSLINSQNNFTFSCNNDLNINYSDQNQSTMLSTEIKIVNSVIDNIFTVQINKLVTPYDNDASASFTFTINLKSKFPSVSGNITLISQGFKAYTSCFIDNVKCNINVGNTVCPALANGSTQSFNICCSGIKLTANKLIISADSSFNDDFIDAKLVESVIFQEENLQLISTLVPTVERIKFSHVNQSGGLGNIYIRLNLIRPIVDNQIITFNTNVLKSIITNDSKCIAYISQTTNFELLTFSEKVLNCLIEISAGEDKIQIKTTSKSNCDVEKNTFLVILLSSVIQQDLSNFKYSISSAVFNESELLTADAVINKQNFPISTFNSYKVKVFDESGNFCKIVNIFPRLGVSEKLIEFEFSLIDFPILTNDDNVSFNLLSNEISIFLSRSIFSLNLIENYEAVSLSENTNLECKYKLIKVNCVWERSGFLNIYLGSDVFKVGEKSSIQIFGLYVNQDFLLENKEEYSKQSLLINASVNYYLTNTGVRQNIMNGKCFLSLTKSIINADSKDSKEVKKVFDTFTSISFKPINFISNFSSILSSINPFNSNNEIRSTTDIRLDFTFDSIGAPSKIYINNRRINYFTYNEYLKVDNGVINKFVDSKLEELTKEFNDKSSKLEKTSEDYIKLEKDYINNIENTKKIDRDEDLQNNMVFVLSLPNTYELHRINPEKIEVVLRYTVFEHTKIQILDDSTIDNIFNFKENNIPFQLYESNLLETKDREYKQSPPIEIISKELIGRSLYITLAVDKLNLDPYFVFFNLYVKGLPTASDKNNYSLNTGLAFNENGFQLKSIGDFELTFYNNKNLPTLGFKTFSNTNNFASYQEKTSKFNIDNYRGFDYNYSSKPYINVFNNEFSETQEFNQYRNKISIKPGRYTLIRFEMNYSNEENYATILSLQNDNNQNLKSIEDSVLINTGTRRKNFMHIGVECSKFKNYYGTEFLLLKNTKEEVLLTPIRITFNFSKEVINVGSTINSNLKNFSIGNNSFSRVFFSSNLIPFENVAIKVSMKEGNKTGFKIKNDFQFSDQLSGSIFTIKPDIKYNQSSEKFKRYLSSNDKQFMEFSNESQLNETNTNMNVIFEIADDSCFSFESNNITQISFSLANTVSSLDDIQLAFKSFQYVDVNGEFEKIENPDISLLKYKVVVPLNTDLYCFGYCTESNPVSISEIKSKYFLSRNESYNEDFKYMTADGEMNFNFQSNSKYSIDCILENRGLKNIQVNSTYNQSIQTLSNLTVINSASTKTSNSTSYVFSTGKTDNFPLYLDINFEKKVNEEIFIRLFDKLQDLLNGFGVFEKDLLLYTNLFLVDDSTGLTKKGYNFYKKETCSIRERYIEPIIIKNTTGNSNSNNTNNNTNSTSISNNTSIINNTNQVINSTSNSNSTNNNSTTSNKTNRSEIDNRILNEVTGNTKFKYIVKQIPIDLSHNFTGYENKKFSIHLNPISSKNITIESIINFINDTVNSKAKLEKLLNKQFDGDFLIKYNTEVQYPLNNLTFMSINYTDNLFVEVEYNSVYDLKCLWQIRKLESNLSIYNFNFTHFDKNTLNECIHWGQSLGIDQFGLSLNKKCGYLNLHLNNFDRNVFEKIDSSNIINTTKIPSKVSKLKLEVGNLKEGEYLLDINCSQNYAYSSKDYSIFSPTFHVFKTKKEEKNYLDWRYQNSTFEFNKTNEISTNITNSNNATTNTTNSPKNTTSP